MYYWSITVRKYVYGLQYNSLRATISKAQNISLFKYSVTRLPITLMFYNKVASRGEYVSHAAPVVCESCNNVTPMLDKPIHCCFISLCTINPWTRARLILSIIWSMGWTLQLTFSYSDLLPDQLVNLIIPKPEALPPSAVLSNSAISFPHDRFTSRTAESTYSSSCLLHQWYLVFAADRDRQEGQLHWVMWHITITAFGYKVVSPMKV